MNSTKTDLSESSNQQECLLKTSKRGKQPKSKFQRLVRSNMMMISVVCSILIGFSIAFTLKYTNMKDSQVTAWLVLPGKLFLRSLRLFILPVIFFGVLNATSSLKRNANAKLSLVCFLIVALSHIIACSIGIGGSFIFSTVSKQYTNGQVAAPRDLGSQKGVYDIVTDILNNLIPKNIIKATMYQEFTQYDAVVLNGNSTERKRKTVDIPDSNILGVLAFAILLGVATGSIGSKGDAFRSFVQSVNHVVMTCLRWLILLGPIGFTSLIIDAVLSLNDLEKNLKDLGIFMLVVSSFCIFYGFILLPIVCFLFVRKNPFKYFLQFMDPMLLAFASTSSGVCIHRSIEICEEKLHLNPTVTRFSLPFYTALQADGSAMFITMSTIFLAYFNNYSLSFSEYLIIMVMASTLCLSMPCVPSSSLLTTLVVMASINLNVSIAPLYACEWILDRVRTAVNVYSHCLCTVITNKLFQNKNFNINEAKFDNGCLSSDHCAKKIHQEEVKHNFITADL